jgi:hypothetical protein
MIIYEVNLSIETDAYSDYRVWLDGHIKEILQLPGFVHATLLKQDKSDGLYQYITIQYQLEQRKDLDRYLSEFAPKMREEGMKLFKDKFSATRRIFEVEEIFRT